MKNKFIAKRYWKDISTPMGKVDELAKQYDDVIRLSLGDPDLTTDSIIIDGAHQDALAGHTKYTDFRGDPELRAEISKYYKERFNLNIPDEEIFVTASGNYAMFLALESILDEGDEVILQGPYYTPYPQQVELALGVPVEFPTYEEEDFQTNVERLESYITERTKAIIVNTPCNPTGNCLSLETMQKIAEIAEKYDLIVIADDIYTAFSYQREFVPFASLPGMRERTITLNSFSKDYTMTGWRVGCIVAPKEIVHVVQEINENVVFTAPSISQRAAIHALRNRAAIQPQMVEEYRQRSYYAAERINNIPKMHVIYPPKGTFYLFINVKETGLTSEEVSDTILREAHVVTIPGNSFGKSGEGYIRIACTVGKDTLKEAFDRVEKVSIFQNN